MKINDGRIPVEIMNHELPHDNGYGNSLLDNNFEDDNRGFASAIVLASTLVIGLVIIGLLMILG